MRRLRLDFIWQEKYHILSVKCKNDSSRANGGEGKGNLWQLPPIYQTEQNAAMVYNAMVLQKSLKFWVCMYRKNILYEALRTVFSLEYI